MQKPRLTYLNRAQRTLEHAYRSGDREPQLLATLGLCYADAGDTAAAGRVLDEAHAARAIRPLAHRTLARLRFAEASAKPEGEAGKHSVAQSLRVIRPLYTARAQTPAAPETYHLLAEVWLATEAVPTQAQLADLREAEKYFPRDSASLLMIARLALRHGFRVDAAATAGRGMAFAPTAELRNEFNTPIAEAGVAAPQR